MLTVISVHCIISQFVLACFTIIRSLKHIHCTMSYKGINVLGKDLEVINTI